MKPCWFRWPPRASARSKYGHHHGPHHVCGREWPHDGPHYCDDCDSRAPVCQHRRLTRDIAGRVRCADCWAPMSPGGRQQLQCNTCGRPKWDYDPCPCGHEPRGRAG